MEIEISDLSRDDPAAIIAVLDAVQPDRPVSATDDASLFTRDDNAFFLAARIGGPPRSHPTTRHGRPPANSPVVQLESARARDQGRDTAPKDPGQPVGLAWGAHVRYPTGRQMTYLHELHVAAGHRDLGVGTTLVHAGLDLARRAGSARFWLSTGGHNLDAQRLYTRLGGDRKPAGDVNYWWQLDSGT